LANRCAFKVKSILSPYPYRFSVTAAMLTSESIWL
jgi:hypothetical protein